MITEHILPRVPKEIADGPAGTSVIDAEIASLLTLYRKSLQQVCVCICLCVCINSSVCATCC